MFVYLFLCVSEHILMVCVHACMRDSVYVLFWCVCECVPAFIIVCASDGVSFIIHLGLDAS